MVMTSRYGDLHRLRLDPSESIIVSKFPHQYRKYSWRDRKWQIIVVALSAVIITTVYHQTKVKKSSISQAIVVESLKPTLVNPKTATPQEILAHIKEIFEGNVGTYSIYILDLKTNRSLGINEQTVLTAASVAKVPILATLYYLADQGEVDLDKTITLRSEDIQDWGTGVIRYSKPGVSYSIKTLARLMMEKSDNTAAYILGRVIIGFPKIQEIIEKWGLTQTNMENNKTSAKDMGMLLTKIYRGEIASQTLTKEMLDFMKDTDFEERLPALLPDSAIVYHKTGDEIGNTHDVGIVELPARSYYIGVLALDLLKGEKEVKQAIAEVSKLVYEYYLTLE